MKRRGGVRNRRRLAVSRFLSAIFPLQTGKMTMPIAEPVKGLTG